MQVPRSAACTASTSLLGDSTDRDYSAKLRSFNAFAEPELRALIRSLELKPGMHVLDAGCGTGEALGWLSSEVQPSGSVVGIDLAAAHVAAARTHASPTIQIHQADLFDVSVTPASFDLVWCVNTINHLSNPVDGVRRLAKLLRRGGRLALGQSSLLPDMYFAWDARLERLTNEAVRSHYRDRYHLEEQDLASVRGIVGILQRANLQNVTARTIVIERLAAMDAASESYLRDAIFRDTWGKNLRQYLSDEDYAELGRLCDPQHPQFALRRPDFHFLQSFTLAVAEV
jgi:ubiquinone/menaquinone biosynthesis C-methylase UbiE